MSIDPVTLAAIVFKAAKTAGITTAALGGYVVAQTNTTLELAGNLGLVALLAVLVGRYTFRQLEDYRTDLKAARKRADRLEEELEVYRARVRELEDRRPLPGPDAPSS